MKSVYLLGLLLLGTVATVSHAQSVQPVDQSSAYASQIDREIGKLARLQANVQPIVLKRQTSQIWENEAWVNSSRTSYDYSDQQTVVLTEEWDGNAWVNSSRIVTTHSGDRVSSTQYETWNGTAWVAETRILNTYSGDQVSEILSQTFLNNAWVDEERTTVTLSGGVFASAQTDIRQGGAWVPSDRYTINQEGDDVVAVSEEWNGSAWINADRTVYNNLTISRLFEIFQKFEAEGDVTFGLSFLLRLPDSVQQEWSGTEWVNVSRQATEHDASDRPVTVTHETWQEGAWLGEARYVVTYNAQGRIEQIDQQFFDEEDWMSFVVETHFYDDAGLLERIVDQFDLGFGITNSTQYLFEWTNTTTAVEDGEVPARIRLAAPYPNPFNPQAIVQYHLTSPEHASLRVFDAAGRLVGTLVNGVRPAGDHTVVFDARGLSSGVYMIRLETPSHVETRSVTLLR